MAETQLIINGISYPIASLNRYTAYPKDEGKLTPMISGRKVKEIRGRRWVIEYNYDYFEDDMLRACLADLRSDHQLLVDFLVPVSGERLTSFFHCIKEPMPSYKIERGGKAHWSNISFILEEVNTWGAR